jgi:hypothetical protein
MGLMRQPLEQRDDHPNGQGERHHPRQDGQKVLHLVRCREDLFHGIPSEEFTRHLHIITIYLCKFYFIQSVNLFKKVSNFQNISRTFAGQWVFFGEEYQPTA